MAEQFYTKPTETPQQTADRTRAEGRRDAFNAWRKRYTHIIKDLPYFDVNRTKRLLLMGGLKAAKVEDLVRYGEKPKNVHLLSWQAAWQKFRPGTTGIPLMPDDEEYRAPVLVRGITPSKKAEVPKNSRSAKAEAVELAMVDPDIHVPGDWPMPQQIAWAKRNLTNPKPNPSECTADAWGLLVSARANPWKLQELAAKQTAGEEEDETAVRRDDDLKHANDTCLRFGSEALQEAANITELELLGLAKSPMEKSVA